MRTQILAAALGAAVVFLVAVFTLGDGGAGPQAVILGIAGGLIGWLAVR